MSVKSFKVKLGKGFVELPFDVKKEFGKPRPPVKISINGLTYRSTVAVYSGKYYVPVRKDRQEAAGVKPGDIVKVTILPDTEVRSIEPPPELAAALAKNDPARAQWEKLSYTHQREHAEEILAAKKSETRARRVQRILEKLTAKTK